MNMIVSPTRTYANRFSTTLLGPSDQPTKNSIADLFAAGNALHKRGRLNEAETVFRKILERLPDHPMALLSLGILAHQTGAHSAALTIIRRVVQIAPKYEQAHNNLGNVLAAGAQFDAAIKHFSIAIELRPNYADAHFNLGATYRKLGDIDAALKALENCRQHQSNRADVYYEIGQCHVKLGNQFHAQIAFRTAAAIDPKHITARISMGSILFFMGRTDEAVEEYQAALEIDPNDLRALNGFSECMKRAGRFEESLETLAKAIELAPSDLETLNNLASTHQSMGDNALAAQYYGRVLELAPGAECAEKSSLFVALNRPELSSGELFDFHRQLRGRHDRPNVTGKTFEGRSRDPNKKLRIGYLSSDFRTHVVALNIMPVLTNHDRTAFEIFLYSQEKSSDRMTEAFKNYADRYTVINRFTDEEVAALIERDEVDILVILAGRFDENRPLVASFRAAPIQISYHDCATSGLRDMDYLFTDSHLHPNDTMEKFTEQLYRLPVYYQYPIQNGLPEVSDTPARTNGFVTFGCFNKPEKLNDDVIRLWADVLHAVPGSKLFLKYFNHYSEPSMQARWIGKFSTFGIEKNRLILKANSDSRADHLTLYHDVDIALDPFPFNGATTTFESLSMGVPVVALRGRHLVDRVAASMVAHAGLPDLIAETHADYVAIAASLADDLDRLNKRRKTIRDQLHASPLCRGGAYAESIETAYRDMWRTWCVSGGYRGK